MQKSKTVKLSDRDEEQEQGSQISEDDCNALNDDFVGVEGTALFSGICTMNHSCDPNCTVLYTKDGAAHVFAVQDVAVSVQRVDILICNLFE